MFILVMKCIVIWDEQYQPELFCFGIKGNESKSKNVILMSINLINSEIRVSEHYLQAKPNVCAEHKEFNVSLQRTK